MTNNITIDRKTMKVSAKHSLKRHYLVFAAVCLIAGFLGTQFTGQFDFVKMPTSFTRGDNSAHNRDEDHTGLVGLDERMINAIIDSSSGNSNSQIEESDTIAESDKTENKIFSRQAGVFAYVVNSITSKSYLITISAGMNSIFGASSITCMILIAISIIVSFIFWFLFTNMYSVVMARIFLEGKTYENVSIERLLFFQTIKRWIKVSWTMCVMEVMYVLWCLTIVGAIIKRYSYFMVPYIVAENPEINALDAISLSRNMMNGHKWECFKLELSFIGWDLLDGFTMGLCGLLFLNPYKIATISEYYTLIRSEAKIKNIKNSDLLNDKYLFEKASKEIINEYYSDIVHEIESLEKLQKPMNENILTKIFGVTLFNDKREKLFQEIEERKIKIKGLKECAERRSYPRRLTEKTKDIKPRKVEVIHYMRHYTVFSLILMFFIFSFIGWTWEVILHLITDGEFVNRGIMHGPYLPIYGAGGLLILVILNKLRKYPMLEFISAIVLCGIIEYFTSYYLEITHNGTKWWDYTGYFLNLDGRICAEGLLLFGIGGMTVVYLIAPLLDNLIRRINNKTLISICAILLVIYFIDMGYSAKYPNKGKGITDYAKIEQVDEIQYFENVQA